MKLPNRLQRIKVRKEKNTIITIEKYRKKIGKHAVTRGKKSALLCLKTKYPELTRQTISDFAKAYQKLKSKSRGSKGKKEQITGTFTVSKSGNFFPVNLFIRGNEPLLSEKC